MCFEIFDETHKNNVGSTNNLSTYPESDHSVDSFLGFRISAAKPPSSVEGMT